MLRRGIERRVAWRATAVAVLDCWTLGRDHEAPRPVGVTKAVVDPGKRASSGMMLEAKGDMAAVLVSWCAGGVGGVGVFVS